MCLARQSRGVRLTHWVGKKKKKKSHLLGALCTFQFTWQSVECGRKRTGSVARTCRRSSSGSSFQKRRFKPGTWLLTREAPLLSLCFTTTALQLSHPLQSQVWFTGYSGTVRQRLVHSSKSDSCCFGEENISLYDQPLCALLLTTELCLSVGNMR